MFKDNKLLSLILIYKHVTNLDTTSCDLYKPPYTLQFHTLVRFLHYLLFSYFLFVSYYLLTY